MKNYRKRIDTIIETLRKNTTVYTEFDDASDSDFEEMVMIAGRYNGNYYDLRAWVWGDKFEVELSHTTENEEEIRLLIIKHLQGD